MIDAYIWPTGNGKKITIMLEECGLEYRAIPVNINKGDQFKPEFEALSPNNKMPAIVDHDGPGGPVRLFESGAILQYLGEKTGKLLPADTHGKYQVLQWVYWQIGGLGPMAGQAHHFLRYAPEKIEYPMRRFREEVARLYTVMDKQLAKHDYLAGEYSIADIACWPWVFRYDWQGQDLNDFPHVKRWFETVGARPAVKKGASIGQEWINSAQQMTDEDRKRLFNLRDEDLKKK
ncbi:MAG TPA: glutathione binding-like protein [Steroidobacteraceae bacterium]|nr:glutathione binding-like protein [Steroidobacteraceae bacterium]